MPLCCLILPGHASKHAPSHPPCDSGALDASALGTGAFAESLESFCGEADEESSVIGGPTLLKFVSTFREVGGKSVDFQGRLGEFGRREFGSLCPRSDRWAGGAARVGWSQQLGGANCVHSLCWTPLWAPAMASPLSRPCLSTSRVCRWSEGTVATPMSCIDWLLLLHTTSARVRCCILCSWRRSRTCCARRPRWCCASG